MDFNVNNEEFRRIIISKDVYLGIEHIQRFNELMKECFNINSLSMAEFQIHDIIVPASPKRSKIQILYRPLSDENMLQGHFVCSYFDTENIFIYDSLKDKKSHYCYDSILHKLYPFYFESGKTIKWPEVQLQCECDCGVFAIAFAVSLLHGIRPDYVRYNYDNNNMRQFLLRIFEERSIKPFPFTFISIPTWHFQNFDCNCDIIKNGGRLNDYHIERFHNLLSRFTVYKPQHTGRLGILSKVKPMPEGERNIQILFSNIEHWICSYYDVSTMESQGKQWDTEPEFYKVEIKEEVFFELIEDQSCSDGINEKNEIKEENKPYVKQIDSQSLTCDGLNKESVLINEIKTEYLSDIESGEDTECVKEEAEIDYAWPEVSVNESDPLALPETICKMEAKHSEEDETVASIGLLRSFTTIDPETARLKADDSGDKQYNGNYSPCGYPYPPSNVIKPTCKNSQTYLIADNSSTSILNSRKTITTGGKPFKCKDCDYVCSQLRYLKVHMRRHNGDKPYQCKECEYSCSQLGSLKAHMRRHSGDKPYQCKQCAYSCSQLQTLKLHIKMHNGDEPHKCKECVYSTYHLFNFNVHMRRHNGVKPYKCKECDYSSYHLFNFKVHNMRRHNGVKPHKCKECDYSCSESSSLKRHMRTHNGDKPYQCKECEYSCSYSKTMKQHMNKHNKDKP